MSAALKTPIVPADACDVAIRLAGDFRLDSGETLSRPELFMRICGDAGRPTLCVAGGISAGRHVADADGVRGWWRDIARRGGPIDVDRWRLIAFDFLPNPGERARTVSTGDQARALAEALDVLRIPRLAAFVGASYGGMIALAFAERFPDRLDKLAVISAADRAHPWATALRGVQRRIIDFARRAGASGEGVALARQLAMATYRTPAEFAARFRARGAAGAGDPYDVCDYLIARGRSCDAPPERYVTLSDSIDRHAVDARKIRARALFVACAEDQLVPARDIARLAAAVPGGRHVAISSVYGHDAFLKEAALIGPVVRRFLEE
jgi:homoserine O-acetyltransferase